MLNLMWDKLPTIPGFHNHWPVFQWEVKSLTRPRQDLHNDETRTSRGVNVLTIFNSQISLLELPMTDQTTKVPSIFSSGLATAS